MSLSPNAPRVAPAANQASSDSELLARTAGGDRGAFDTLVHRHRDAVYRWVRTLTSSEDQAEDVLQETFIAAFRHAHTFRGGAAVRTWLFTIARNQTYRGARKRRDVPVDDAGGLEQLGRAAGWGSRGDPEQVVAAQERKAQLRHALDRLSPHDREVIVARDLTGLTGPEAAELLGLSLAAMKARLHRARLRLVAELRNGGNEHGT